MGHEVMALCGALLLAALWCPRAADAGRLICRLQGRGLLLTGDSFQMGVFMLLAAVIGGEPARKERTAAAV
eukprot:gene31195-60783_t